jgi:hypothetical protein
MQQSVSARGRKLAGKEVIDMKTINAMTFALSLGLIGFASVANAWDGIVSKSTAADGSYCHMKFSPIDPVRSTVEHPVLEGPNTGDLVDFYGSCDHDPLGKDEVQAQLQQRYRDSRE